MSLVEKVKWLAPTLKSVYSASRMPYTSHHDYMRAAYPQKYSSRADVAEAFRDVGDEHLYSIAFLALFQDASTFDVLAWDKDQRMAAKEILAAAEYNLSLL